MTDSIDDLNPPPWWKQFWPWFLISIPAGTIVAAMYTINLAVKTNDGLVSKDYYKDGLAIHMDADALQRARELGIRADLKFQRSDSQVQVRVTSAGNQAIGQLALNLRHPTRADRDSTLQLQPVGPDTYQAALPSLDSNDWNVELTAAESGWQLRGRLDLGQSSELTLQ